MVRCGERGAVARLASLCLLPHPLAPPFCRSTCVQRYRLPLPTAPPAEPASSCSSGGSIGSTLHPKDLSLLIEGALEDSPAPPPPAPPAAALPAADAPAPDAVLGRAASITIPPSPNRAKLLAGQERQRAELDKLQATFAALPGLGRKAHAQVGSGISLQGGGCDLPSRALALTWHDANNSGCKPSVYQLPSLRLFSLLLLQDAEVPPSPAAASIAAASGTPPSAPRAAASQSPGPLFASPMQVLADVSPLGSVFSPDIFAGLQSPPPPTVGCGAGDSSSHGAAVPASDLPALRPAPAAAPLAQQAPAAAAMPAVGGAAAQPKPANMRDRAWQCLRGMVRPSVGSSRILGAAPMAEPARQHSDPLAAADAARSAAILGLCGEPLRQPAFDSPTAFDSPLSATVDVGGAGAAPAAAAAAAADSTVQQPSRRRRGWGSRSNAEGDADGSLEPPRRALSALSLSSISGGLGGGLAASAARPQSACDEAPPHTGESFNIYSDAGSSVKGSPADASTHRRLSFEFSFNNFNKQCAAPPVTTGKVGTACLKSVLHRVLMHAAALQRTVCVCPLIVTIHLNAGSHFSTLTG